MLLKLGQLCTVQLEHELFQDVHVQQLCESGGHLPTINTSVLETQICLYLEAETYNGWNGRINMVFLNKQVNHIKLSIACSYMDWLEPILLQKHKLIIVILG